MSAIKLNWWMDVLLWLCKLPKCQHRSRDRDAISAVTVKPCVCRHVYFHRRSVFIVEHYLSPTDFSVELFKRKCVQTQPTFTGWTKRQIQDCILDVTTETLHKVASNMRKRVDSCIAKHGGHFQHLLQDRKCNLNCRIKFHVQWDIFFFNFFLLYEFRKNFYHPV